MKVRTLMAALAVSCWLVGAPAMAQRDSQPDKKQPAKPGEKPADKAPKGPSEEEQKMMAAMEAAGKPGAAHEKLAQLAGQWDAKVKYKMAPDAPWAESNGSCSNQMWYDGRYLHQNFSADMEGMPFKGMAVMGYNNMTKEYESTWIDNMSTGIMVMTGRSDSAGKVLTLTGESADPMQPGKKKKMREVTTISSSDRHTSEFFESGPGGKEYNSMVIVYTRKPGSDKEETKPAKTTAPEKNTGAR